jgi:hypothetical protein
MSVRRSDTVSRAARGALHAVALAAVAAVAACGSGEPPTGPGPATISISLSPSSGTVEQGGTLTATGSATVGGSFTGDVDFAVTGLPAGVTVTVGAITPSGTTFSVPITVNVAASVAPGTYSGTVTATGSGVSDQTSYSLVVTEATSGTFSLGSVSDVSSPQGGSAIREVSIARAGGFTGDVTIEVEDVPSGVTATSSPATTSGTTSTITIDVGAGAATGTASLTVRGTATGLPDATTTFDLTVTPASSGADLTLDYSSCLPDEQPVWFAFQDGAGTGDWIRLTGTNHVYDLSISGGTFGIAVVLDQPGMTDLSVDYFGVAQIEDDVLDACTPPVTKTVSGTAAGTVGFTNISLGGAMASALVFTDGPFQLSGVPDGPQDLVAFSLNSGAGSDRMVIQRDLNVADNGSVGTVAFTADGFDAASATITLDGLPLGVSGLAGMDYASRPTGGVCTVSPLHSGVLSGETFAAMSAPADQRESDEFHVATISAGLEPEVKQVREAFATMADRTVVMPADLPTPTLTDLTGSAGYLRLQADYVLPSEYDDLTFFDYSADTWNMTIFATGDAMSTDVSFVMPDFSSVTGWDDAWAIPPATTGVEYVISATGLTDREPLCTDGGRSVSAALTGSYN